MKKRELIIFFSFLFLILLPYIPPPVAAIDDATAGESIREQITSGIYTSGNLHVSFDTSSLPSQVKIEMDKKVALLNEFKVGDNIVIGNNTVDRIAFLTFTVDANAFTLYDVDSAMTINEFTRQICYAKVATYDENWLGQNINSEEHYYYIKYHDYTIQVKSQLGVNGNLPIKITFDTSDFQQSEIEVSPYESFLTTGIMASIDSVSITSAQLRFIDKDKNTYYQSDLNPDSMPKNKVYDIDQNEYKSQDDIPDEYTKVSSKLAMAGLTGEHSEYYYTTRYPTGHQAALWCQQGELSKDSNGRFLLGIRAEPQVQVKAQRLTYRQIRSARNDYISIKNNVGETSEYPDAYLQTKTITRTLGAEVYNVNIHFSMKVVVKLIVSTKTVIKTSDVSDSHIDDLPQYQQGDMYWDNAMEQEVGDYIFDTMSPVKEWWNGYSMFDFSNPTNKLINSILWLVIGAAFIFIAIRILPMVLSIYETREKYRMLSRR